MLQHRLSTVVALLVCLVGFVRAQKPTLTYCSPDNNAGLYSPKYDEFMSTGLCSDHCRGSFAMAIVQGNQCWCSNFAPGDQVDTSECNTPCPGTGNEWCGNPDEGLYGYFQIALGTVLGTSGGSGPTSAAQTTSPSSSSSSPSNTITSPSVITSLVTTGAGPPSTVFVTQTPKAAPSEDALGQAATSSSGGGVSGGAIAGIVIGVIGGLAAIIGGLLWFFCRRRRNLDRSRNSSFTADRIGGGSSSGGPQSNSVPSRQVSQMSQAGLLGSKAPRINTTGLGGLAYDNRSADPSSANADRRSVGTDQRLNPWAIYKSDDQASSVSLHDERDYSRQLRVANPDE